MKISKKATSIVEAMIVTLIISSWLVWVYKIYDNSNKLSDGVKNKIQAIQIAREWIEAFTNIRDTNWLRFSSNYEDCWNTLNYETDCISSTNINHIIKENELYKIYKNADNRWQLKEHSDNTEDFSNSSYRDFFKIWLDENWLYTQTWSTSTGVLTPIFTREIKISYLDSPATWKNYEKLKVTSKVVWTDSSSSKNRKVVLDSILTNWKNKKN